MKKLLSLVLVLTLILSSFAFATPTDVVGTDYEGAVNKLMGLNILTGYTDGTFKPAATITRAEFAAVAVRLLGLEQAATYAKGATKFADVPATHWASGYVNIASDQGIINGYPNGTFNPSAQVSYSEAITMLVRVLGYAPEVDEKGTWPSNYIAKASILGVTDGVTFAGSIAALRGDIATMADNSLTIPNMIRTGFGTDATYVVPTGVNEITLLANKIKATSFEGYVVNTKALESDYKHDVKLDQLKSTSNLTEELDFASKFTFDFTSHLGEKVKAWKNVDGDIFFVETKGTVVNSKLASALTTEVEVLKAGDNTDVATYYFDDKATHVATAGAAKIYINVVDNADFTKSVMKEASAAEVAALSGANQLGAKLVLDGKVVKAAVFTKWTAKTVEAVGTDKIEIAGKDIALAGMSTNVDLKTIAKDDRINFYAYNTNVENAAGDDIVRFEIVKTAAAVEGKLTKVTSNKITVGTTEYLYKTANSIFTPSTAAYDTRAEFEGALDDTIKITFDKYGCVDTVKNVATTASGDYGLVADMGASTNAYGKTTVVVKLLNAKNEVVEYTLASDATLQNDGVTAFKLDAVTSFTNNAMDLTLTVASPAATFVINENDKAADAAGQVTKSVVTYKLNSDGKISTLNVRTISAGNLVSVAAGDYDKDLSKLGAYKLSASTTIYNRATEKVVTLAELKDEATYKFYVIKDADSSLNDAEFVLVSTGTVATDSKYAFYQKYDTVSNGFNVYLWLAGVRTAYFASDDDVTQAYLNGLTAAGVATQAVVEVKFSGTDVTEMTTKALVTGKTLVDVDAAGRIIAFNGGDVQDLATDVQVYNYSIADGYSASDVASLDADDTGFTYNYLLVDSKIKVIIVVRP